MGSMAQAGQVAGAKQRGGQGGSTKGKVRACRPGVRERQSSYCGQATEHTQIRAEDRQTQAASEPLRHADRERGCGASWAVGGTRRSLQQLAGEAASPGWIPGQGCRWSRVVQFQIY